MRLSVRDAIATLLVAAIAVPYVGYLIDGSMPFVEDPRGMSAVGLILGVVAFFVGRRTASSPFMGKVEAVALGAVALVAGIVAVAFAETQGDRGSARCVHGHDLGDLGHEHGRSCWPDLLRNGTRRGLGALVTRCRSAASSSDGGAALCPS